MAGFRDVLVRAALWVSLLVPVYFLIAALGTKFGLIDWRIGFGLMTFRLGALVLMGAAGLAVLALILSLLVSPRRGAVTALLALVVPAIGLGYGLYVRDQAQAIPPIHDIATDLADPPGFTPTIIAARDSVEGVNGLDLYAKRSGDGRSYIELQREAYADIAPVVTTRSRAEAYAAALEIAETQGWEIVTRDAEAGLIEATARSFWYGFADDIVIRVRPEGAGARVDMRSVSRVGISDLGANAARMRPYLAEVRARLE